MLTTIKKFQLEELAVEYHRRAANIYFAAFNEGGEVDPQEREQLQTNCEFHKSAQFHHEQEANRLAAVIDQGLGALAAKS